MATTSTIQVSDNDSELHDDSLMDEANQPMDSTNERNPATEVKEWTILVKLMTNGSDKAVNIVKLHRTIFSMMLATDDTLVFKTFDGSTITSLDNFPKGAEYATHFQIKETKKQFVLAHNVYSTKSIADIKRLNPNLLDFLNTNNIFIDVSASGSLMEIMLGPILGVHPDNTSKQRIKTDLTSLLLTHTRLDNKVQSLRDDAKHRLPFEGTFPPFQLRTRRIQRIIDDTEYSAKTTVFVCAIEHRAYWEHLLVGGMSDNWLTSIGRFYLLRREDKSEALRSALCWHNKMLSTMKATFITGISSLLMDSSVKPPHNNNESPTLRQHLLKGGFITIISSNEKNKWIGISADIEPAKHYVNTHIRDLCTAAYDDGTAPIATDATSKSSRPPRAAYRPSKTEDRTPLFEQQSKSWADITKAESDDDTSKFTSSTIAKRFPRVVKFKSKIRFDDNEDDSKEEDATKCSAIDTATAATSITIDDLMLWKHASKQESKGTNQNSRSK